MKLEIDFLFEKFSRIFRIYLSTIAAVFLLMTPTNPAFATTAVDVTVYRDPDCRCCEGWMTHLSAQGFRPSSILTADLGRLKQQLDVPQDLTSCHTALVNGYVIEGHVLAADIKRLLAEQSQVAGLAVPGMPVGTPGMESGEAQEAFSVFSFDHQGNTAIFNSYPAAEPS
jgi:hypothetical protein